MSDNINTACGVGLVEASSDEINDSRERFTHTSYTARNGDPIAITYCTSVEQLQDALEPFLKEDFVGLDCEWKPYVKANAGDRVPRIWTDGYIRPMSRTKEALSTAQFASRDQIVVAHFAVFETEGDDASQLVPSNLRSILSSQAILKLGNGIQQDANVCHKYLGIQCHGLIDLKDIHRLITPPTNATMGGGGQLGLRGMINSYLKKWVSGKGGVQMSNWSLPQALSAEQLEYAGNDAFAAIIVHEAMLSRLDTDWREDLLPSSSSLDKKRKAKAQLHPRPKATLEEMKARNKAAEDRKRAEGVANLTPDLRGLYDSLKARSLEWTREAALRPWPVPHLCSLFKIVKCSPLPVTVEAIEMLSVGKGAKSEFVYEIVNIVRESVGLEALVVPEGWTERVREEGLAKEKEAKEAKEAKAAKVAKLEGV
ncbi:hypothetical protein E2P81_ATG03312 [Venturia nashicola]|uniref:3'-5' exonuclease domain-containing protein n=1 Tax=Venturia nashicola TaxID=86259 RepID=A0A4Z1P6I6_9PEZI|nr:hypothetical protein E6O75_ATG03381 [Venturia nashicola]TLD36423.1 hypothetical protein E2P81_ATG03312 [Venturia nashicola]